MALLLELPSSQIEPEQLHEPDVIGVVVPISSSDLTSGHFNASLLLVSLAGKELFCLVNRQNDTLTTQERWAELVRLQSFVYHAKIVLPFSKQSLELVALAARYGWQWQIEGVSSLAQVARALTSGAQGIWIRLGSLDRSHELSGDELCAQVRGLIDERFVTNRPLLVATDIVDQDHIERTLQYGCDRVVVSPTA
jgi:hypothetical protein